MSKVQIAGRAHPRFGERKCPDIQVLMASVSSPAITDEGIGAAQVDGVPVGISHGDRPEQLKA